MIERPEANTIAGQIDQMLRGARIERAERENSPHKWAFYNRPREEYESIPVGKQIENATSVGSMIAVALDSGHVLQLGDGGERIALLGPDDKLPKKYHLLWEFDDGRRLVVSIQGWGAARLFDAEQQSQWEQAEGAGIDPLSDDFTYDSFCAVVDDYVAACNKPLKAMLVNQPRIRGIGNGYLQDILHRAMLHPARKAPTLTKGERRKLYQAIRAVLLDAVKKCGRDDELDLYGKPGRYVRKMDRRTLGTPCPRCGDAIDKLAFMGGTCYLCPTCQPKERS